MLSALAWIPNEAASKGNTFFELSKEERAMEEEVGMDSESLFHVNAKEELALNEEEEVCN